MPPSVASPNDDVVVKTRETQPAADANNVNAMERLMMREFYLSNISSSMHYIKHCSEFRTIHRKPPAVPSIC